ncbi:MAG: Hsp33 family molecular chaperone HslO [Clostridia bacterium]|nr:Hsp33 family molecular chaperone HslO [Clostridia bacterium]
MNNVLRTLIYNGQVSLTLVDATEIAKEGIQLHKISKGSSQLFAKALAVMTFMSAALKNEQGEISLALKCDGAAEEIAISGNRALRLRGYIAETQLSDGFSEREMLGEGSMTIIRDDGYNRPFVGACAFPERGGIDEIFEEYYRISEQLPTRIETSIEFDETGALRFVGAAVLQPLPFADKETLEKVEAADLFGLLEAVKTKGVEIAAADAFTKDETVWEVRGAVYKCNCSREYLTRVLVSLGEEQMREIIREDGSVHVHCHYCNTDYHFTEEDADRVFRHS